MNRSRNGQQGIFLPCSLCRDLPDLHKVKFAHAWETGRRRSRHFSLEITKSNFHLFTTQPFLEESGGWTTIVVVVSDCLFPWIDLFKSGSWCVSDLIRFTILTSPRLKGLRRYFWTQNIPRHSTDSVINYAQVEWLASSAVVRHIPSVFIESQHRKHNKKTGVTWNGNN